MEKDIPLVVDLDGTLLRGELSLEASLTFLATNPKQSFNFLQWWFEGMGFLKEKVAENIQFDVSTLPFDQDVLNLVKEQKNAGRTIVLATGSAKPYAQQIADYLKLFDVVLGTENNINFTANNKKDRLVELYGEKGFDYVGNSNADIKVWAAARKAYVVNPEFGVEKKAKALGNVVLVIKSLNPSPKTWFKALHCNNWYKSLAIFLPLILFNFSDATLWILTILGFLLFTCVTAGVSLFQDLLEVNTARLTNTFNLFSKGELPIKKATIISAVTVLGSLLISSLFFPWKFTLILLIFAILLLLIKKLPISKQLRIGFKTILYILPFLAGFCL